MPKDVPDLIVLYFFHSRCNTDDTQGPTGTGKTIDFTHPVDDTHGPTGNFNNPADDSHGPSSTGICSSRSQDRLSSPFPARSRPEAFSWPEAFELA